jgi:hypothetical protein
MIPLSAIGVSVIMIGLTCISLARTRSNISGDESEILLKTGTEITAALLEELGIRNKAVYLPSGMRGGTPQALIPLKADKEINLVKTRIEGNLLVKYGDNLSSMAIVITTPGSKIINMLETKPGPVSGEIEAAVTYILEGVLDIADSAKVYLKENLVEVEVGGNRLEYEDNWYYRCAGTPVASIVATIVGEALQKPVRIEEESCNQGKRRLILEVLS